VQPKTIAALVFLLLAGAAAYWQLGRTDEHAETEAPPSPMPAFAASEIDELIIEDAAAPPRVALTKSGEAWALTAPLADAADANNVTSALEQLANARVNARPAATSKQSWSKLKIADDQALTVTLRKGGADVAIVHLSADARYLRIGDGTAVFAVHDVNRSMLVREPRAWRDRLITSFDPAQVASVSVTAADGVRATAKRTPAGEGQDQDSWELTEGRALIKSFDPSEVTGAVSRMQKLAALDFADDQDLASAALTEPRLRVEVALDDGTSQILLVGGDVDAETVYVGRAGSERVWTAAKATINSFAKAPLQWRDKGIAKLAPGNVIRIDIRHGADRIVAVRDGAAWKLEKPAGAAANTAKLDALAGAMQNLRGVAVATETSKAVTGLGKPTAVVTFTPNDGKAVTVTLGAQADKTSKPRDATTCCWWRTTWYAACSSRQPMSAPRTEELATRVLRNEGDAMLARINALEHELAETVRGRAQLEQELAGALSRGAFPSKRDGLAQRQPRATPTVSSRRPWPRARTRRRFSTCRWLAPALGPASSRRPRRSCRDPGRTRRRRCSAAALCERPGCAPGGAS